MAKDAIINVRSGDIVLSNSDDNVRYYEVKWGKIWDYDLDFYMNIIVPYYEIGKMTFSNNEQIVLVRASYHPVCQNFIVRLVVVAADDTYRNMRDYVPLMPIQFHAFWKPTIDSIPKELSASELPLINIDGYYLVRLMSYNDSNFNMAMVYSAYHSDLKIDEADSQSAQLLSLCGAGKFYRFPMNGVDITKYINSVVANTDLGQKLQSEFESDKKLISEATFDSNTGDLNLAFDSNNEEDEGNLTPIEDLELDLFKVADDKYIETITAEVIDEVDPSDVIVSFEDLSEVFGVYVFDGVKKTRLADAVEQSVIFDADGNKETRGDYLIIKAAVKADSFIQFILPDDYDSPIIFTLANGVQILYKDYPNAKDSRWFNDEYKMGAIVLKDCTISYAIARKDFGTAVSTNIYGVYVAEPDTETIKDFLVVTHNKVTSKLAGYVSMNTNIKAINLNQQTGHIWVLQVEE